MSGYELYDFLAIDNPLTEQERKEVSSLSSRTKATSYSASFLYHYGGSLGNGVDVLLKYFDAFLYYTNWGSAHLSFRFPNNAIDIKLLEQYEYSYSVRVTKHEKYTILEMMYDSEEGFGWVDGEGLLSTMVGLRQDIINGDMRAPYLMWLQGVQVDIEYGDLDLDDIIEPPLPNNFKHLQPQLEAFTEFMMIEDALLETLARASSTYKKPKLDIEKGLTLLSSSEKDAFLTQLAQNVPNLSSQLQKRLRELLPDDAQKPDTTTFKVMDILQNIETVEREQALALEAKENAYLDDLKAREDKIWQNIHWLISQKKTKSYEEAIEHLVELRKVAMRDDTMATFQAQISEIYEIYSTLKGLHSRLAYKDFKK